MKILSSSRKGGFTLIELIVVIAIIAILTGIIITNLVGSKAKSRDAKRGSDLSQISLALEEYFDRCDQYPANITNLAQSGGCPSGVTLGTFITAIPNDPSSGNSYGYSVTGSPPTDYILYTTFEATNSVVGQSAANPSWFSSFTCISGLHYCVRPV